MFFSFFLQLERLTAEEDELQKKYRNLRQTATTGIISQLQKLQAQQSREKNDINTLSDEIKSHRRSMQVCARYSYIPSLIMLKHISLGLRVSAGLGGQSSESPRIFT